MQRSSAQGVNSDLGHSISAQVGQILDPEQVTLPLHIGLINPPKSLRRPPALCLYIPDQGLHILAVSPTPGSPVPSPLLLRMCLLLCGYFFPAPALGFSPVQMAPSEPLPGCDWLEVPIAAAPPLDIHMYLKLRTLWTHSSSLLPRTSQGWKKGHQVSKVIPT